MFLSVSGAKSVEGEQERECVCGREALTAKGRSSVCLAAAAAAAAADGAKRQARLQPNCYVQSPEFKFRFVFFRFQLLRFSVVCGPNVQKFGELLT